VAGAVVAVVEGVGFFFFACASALLETTGVSWVEAATVGATAATAATAATGCFLAGVGGILYYFMITYITICLYNFMLWPYHYKNKKKYKYQ
jgi:hypothetical protein